MLSGKIKRLVEKYYPRGVEIRRRIHRYPELSGEEAETAGLAADMLREFGIETRAGIAGHGVLGLIRGAKPGKTVLLRADMDALEVNEAADVPYRSVKPGVMHACGHDGHTAGLLIAAMALSELKDDIPGTVKLMFQPAEETIGGALPMIEAGILDGPPVDAAFGCHLWGSAAEGTVRVKAGPVMASPDEFSITLRGPGGHGALPHLTVDTVVLAAQIVLQFQTIVSRRKNPLDAAALSVCAIHGGEAFNVIPDEVRLEGTIRTFNEEARSFIPREMEKSVRCLCEAVGASYSFEVKRRYPPLVNDPVAVAVVRAAAEKIVGADRVLEAEANMGGEDFSYIAERTPSAFFFLGIARDGKPVIHHSPYFQWDDRALFTYACCLCQTALDFLLQ
jgi:amidohydrolase